jgi:fumarylacetoacetate (FAA) hydrolase
MKLASTRAGGRDGSLIVVSRDLRRAVAAHAIVPTLRQAIEDWARFQPPLAALSDALNAGEAPGAFALDVDALAAPLPRAFQWCDGSAYLSHAELVRKARNAEMPAFLYDDPLMYQGGSDGFLGPTEPIRLADEAWGIDLEAEIAVVTDDVPMGISAEAARGHVRLLMLVNDVSLRNLIPNEVAKGFGFVVSKPATAFSPVAVTPDELGDAWDGGRIALPLRSWVNGELLGQPNAGVDLSFDFPRLIAHAATSRMLSAGTIIGSGTIANRDPAAGASCLQEKRMREKLATGSMQTPFLKFGDRVRIEMLDAAGASIFGAIDQRVEQYRAPA